MTPVPGSPFSNVGSTTLYLRCGFADDLLFSSSRTDNTLRIYRIDALNGVLSEVLGSPFASSNPAGVVGPVLPRP